MEAAWLLIRQAPNHTAIAQYRCDHGGAFKRSRMQAHGSFAFIGCRPRTRRVGEVDGSRCQIQGRLGLPGGAGEAEADRRSDCHLSGGTVCRRFRFTRARSNGATDRGSRAGGTTRARDAGIIAESGGLCGWKYLSDRRDRHTQHVRGGPWFCTVQSVVNGVHGLIVVHEVHDDSSDKRSLQSISESAREALGGEGLDVLADAG